MPYKEPGAYLNLVTSSKYAAGSTPSLIPLIMGGGAKIMKRTDVITRAKTGNVDYLPMNAQSILAVGVTTRKATYFQTVGEAIKDFIFIVGQNTISWETSATNKPAASEQYYVTYTYEVSDEQYAPRLVFPGEVETYYGSEFKEFEVDGDTGVAPINRLVVAAKIALEVGAPAVYVVQVPENATSHTVTAVEYKAALENYVRHLNDAYRIVPVDVNADINSAIDAHVEECSSYEERKERKVIYGAPLETVPSDFTAVNTGVGGYAAAKAYKRINVIYPDSATRLLSDGNYYELDAPFLAAAYAGREAALPVYQSKTRDSFSAFNALKGVKMTRKQLNVLAEKGVLIFEQPAGPGTDIIVRHQLTTDMTSVQTKEDSIVTIGDFASKYFRKICETYIGKFNITGETIARIQATLNSGIYQLKKDLIITSGTVTSLQQDEANPDALLISIRIQPPYPCNYIEITLFLD